MQRNAVFAILGAIKISVQHLWGTGFKKLTKTTENYPKMFFCDSKQVFACQEYDQ